MAGKLPKNISIIGFEKELRRNQGKVKVIESPMAGKVVEVLVAVGQNVAEDDEVIILEAMKMENPVYAPESGVVKEIKVEVGKKVAEGEVLVVME